LSRRAKRGLEDGVEWAPVCFFFFSSRRRHTRWPRDWSSDVCSSDLHQHARTRPLKHLQIVEVVADGHHLLVREPLLGRHRRQPRSEERRVGKECTSRWSPYHQKKKKVLSMDISRVHTHVSHTSLHTC